MCFICPCFKLPTRLKLKKKKIRYEVQTLYKQFASKRMLATKVGLVCGRVTLPTVHSGWPPLMCPRPLRELRFANARPRPTNTVQLLSTLWANRTAFVFGFSSNATYVARNYSK